MSKRNDELWLEHFEILKEYVGEFNHFPHPLTEYKGFRVGQWLRNQVKALSEDNLPANRLQLLNEIHPAWSGKAEKRAEASAELFLTSDWKQQVPEGHTPIDVYTHDKEALYFYLKRGIFDCESLAQSLARRKKLQRALEVYTAIYPNWDPQYVKLYFAVESIHQKDLFKDSFRTKVFMNKFAFTSREDMHERVEDALKTLLPQEASVLKLYYGLGLDRSYNLTEIGDLIGLTTERIRQIVKAATYKLRHASRRNKLYYSRREIEDAESWYNRAENEMSLDKLSLSVPTLKWLDRLKIVTVRQLYSKMRRYPDTIIQSDPRGREAYSEIYEKLPMCRALLENQNGNSFFLPKSTPRNISVYDTILDFYSCIFLVEYGIQTLDQLYTIMHTNPEALLEIPGITPEAYSKILALDEYFASRLQIPSEEEIFSGINLDRPYRIDLFELDLSTRACNCLRRSNINTVEKLYNILTTDPESLLRIRGFGKNLYHEVTAKLSLCKKLISQDRGIHFEAQPDHPAAPSQEAPNSRLTPLAQQITSAAGRRGLAGPTTPGGIGAR